MATKFVEMLETLHRGEVRFVLVGGVSAVLHGAPLHTFDVDVVHARDSALAELDRVAEGDGDGGSRELASTDCGRSARLAHAVRCGIVGRWEKLEMEENKVNN